MMGSISFNRIGRSQIFMVLATVAIAASVLFAVSAQAAPPTPDADIWLEGSGGAEARAAAPVVAYGSTAAFEHAMSGKMAKDYVLTINVTCRQDGVIVYNWFGQPDFDFPMRQQGGNVYEWGEGPADCTAALRYGAHNRVTVVATTGFMVE